MRLLIIADDFTGALDTGVQLSKHNIPTTVMSDPDTVPALPDGCQVLVINANIRHSAPDQAYHCIHALLTQYSQDFDHVYLKTDSVLRGNLSAAFAAVIDVFHKPVCFIPAFPKMKRITKDAMAYVDNQPLEKSVFKDDPRTPATTSYIPDILNKTHPVVCESIPVENYASITQNSLNRDTVYIMDCETTQQMDTIGCHLAREGMYGLTAGCAGFAATFAAHLPFRTRMNPLEKKDEPVLFVSGSANAVTLKQLDYARQHQYPVTSLYNTMFSNINYSTKVPKDKGLYKDLTFDAEVERACFELSRAASVVIATATDKSQLQTPESVKKLLTSEEELHNHIASYTSSLVKSISDRVPIVNMAVFGGDMVSAVLKQLDCHQVEALGEITDGVPLCRITYRGRSITLVTKSGGFGDADVIPVIEKYLRSRDGAE